MSDLKAPMVLTKFPHEIEATALINVLRQRGIDAHATGAAISGFRAEAPADVSVVVRAEQLEQAQRIMAEVREEPSGVDWSQVDVGDPTDEQQEVKRHDYGLLKSIILLSLVIGMLWLLAITFFSS